MVQMWNEILEQPSVLKKCAAGGSSVIAKLVAEIRQRDIGSVVIAARGTSDHAAVYTKYILEYKLGIPVALAAPSIVTIYNRKLKLENSLVIGISQSGKAADALEVIKSANECGALTVTITNDPGSPLATEAGYHLFCDAGVEKSVAATKTFTAEMMLAAQLVAEWSGDDDMKKELGCVPDKISIIFNQSDDMISKVERYRFMNECFVLARGVNFSAALEAALKIQETCYVRAKAYSASDFHHGPFAMIEDNMPVIIYAPNGPSLKDMEEMTGKVKKNGAEVIMVSNNEMMLEAGDCFFTIPETCNDIVSPFYNAVIAQMFACRLSLAKGLNPDAPRGLKKVTITK